MYSLTNTDTLIVKRLYCGTEIIEDYKPYLPSNTGGKKRGQSFSRGISKNAKESSKTFEGIAKAMAEQWG